LGQPQPACAMGCGQSQAKKAEEQQVKPVMRRGSFQAGGVNEAPLQANSRVAYYSNHGWMKKSSILGMGKSEVRPKINQDRVVVSPKIGGKDDAWLLACYDGNGPKGEEVSEFVAYEMIKQIGDKPEELFVDDPTERIKKAFRMTNAEVIEKKFTKNSGSTATVVLINGGKAWVANVGDSKAVRGVVSSEGKWLAETLTTDHKPDEPEERKRIEEAGGFVLEDADYGAARIYDNPDPIGQMASLMAASGGMGGLGGMNMDSMGLDPWPGLAVSRVLGHTGVQKVGITCVPDVKCIEFSTSDKVFILASDGIWDFIEPDEAVQMCKALEPDANAACKALVETASQRWIEDDPTYRDDISAIVVFMPLDSKVTLSSKTYNENDFLAAEKAKLDATSKAKADAKAALDKAKGVTNGNGKDTADINVTVDSKPNRPKASKEQKRRSVVTRFG